MCTEDNQHGAGTDSTAFFFFHLFNFIFCRTCLPPVQMESEPMENALRNEHPRWLLDASNFAVCSIRELYCLYPVNP